MVGWSGGEGVHATSHAYVKQSSPQQMLNIYIKFNFYGYFVLNFLSCWITLNVHKTR